jgi:hypothetical protein
VFPAFLPRFVLFTFLLLKRPSAWPFYGVAFIYLLLFLSFQLRALVSFATTPYPYSVIPIPSKMLTDNSEVLKPILLRSSTPGPYAHFSV